MNVSIVMDNWTSGVNCTVWNSLPSVLRDDSLSLNSEHVLAGAELRLICLDSSAHHPAQWRRFVTVAPSIHVMTYLLTYLYGSDFGVAWLPQGI